MLLSSDSQVTSSQCVSSSNKSHLQYGCLLQVCLKLAATCLRFNHEKPVAVSETGESAIGGYNLSRYLEGK
jgi:hypothetical protein